MGIIANASNQYAMLFVIVHGKTLYSRKQQKIFKKMVPDKEQDSDLILHFQSIHISK
jgi:DNA-nicking Smr family endonuclease